MATRDKPRFLERVKNVYRVEEAMVIRILLGKISAEWMAVIADLVCSDPCLEIVGVLESPLDILLKTKDLSADVVVLSQLRGGGEPGICSHFLLEYPNVALLLLPASSETGILWRMVMGKQNCGQASGATLHTALKDGISAGGEAFEAPSG